MIVAKLKEMPVGSDTLNMHWKSIFYILLYLLSLQYDFMLEALVSLYLNLGVSLPRHKGYSSMSLLT
jgi:hypothetical protein